MRKFVLRVKYGAGEANMLTDKPDLVNALQEFLDEYKKAIPDSKIDGMPAITKVEIMPLMYRKEV
jgi:hypothetical protein